MLGKLTKYCLLIFSLSIYQPVIFAQDPAKIDSLENALKSKNRKSRFEILIALSSELARTDHDRSLALADEAINLSKKIHDFKLEVSGYINKGYCYELNYEDSLAALMFQKAFEISEKEHYDEGKAEALYRTGKSLSYQKDYARSSEYLDKSLQLSKNIKNLKIEGQVLSSMADNMRQTGNINAAIMDYNEALNAARSVEDISTMGNVYSSLGAIYYARGNFHEAINNYEESRKMRIRQGNMLRVAQIENNIANAYYNLARYDMAIEYYQKALPIFEKFKYSPGIASIYNGMAVIYFDQKLYDKSLENHLKKLEISRETGNLKEVGNTLNNIGNVYEKITYDSLSNIIGPEFEDIIIREKTDKYLMMYSRALNYYNQSLQIRKDLNDRPGLIITLGNIGILYMHSGKLDTALEYLEMTRTLSQEMNNINELARALMRIGQICSYKYQYDAALQYLNKSLDYAIQTDIKALMQEIYGILSNVYEKKNDYYQALVYYKLYSDVKDSISRKETLNMMTEMQVKFETENIVKANELLMVQSQLSEAKVKQQKILIYFFIIILFLISVLVFFMIRRNYLKREKTHPAEHNKLFSGLWFKKISLKLLRLFHWLI